MKLFIAVAFLVISIVSCKKNQENGHTLSSLQHTWSIISENGEAYRYVGVSGDYYNFSTNGRLYRHTASTDDTSKYTLNSSGQILSLYPITDNVPSTTGTNYQITRLNDSLLILSSVGGSFFVTDSLKR